MVGKLGGCTGWLGAGIKRDFGRTRVRCWYRAEGFVCKIEGYVVAIQSRIRSVRS